MEINVDKAEKKSESNEAPKQLGELLKSYRETAEMDITQAADALCLTPGTLKALENEEFDKLPEAPYLRGYLRGYAKLANVNSSEVIALYETTRGGNAVASDAQYNFSPSSSINDLSKPLIPPYLVQLGIFAVIVLIFTIIYMIPGVKEWSNSIWDEFSHSNVVADQSSPETVPKPIEQTSLTVAKSDTTPQAASTTANKEQNTNDKNSESTANTAAMKGTINRQGTEVSDSETTLDAKTKTNNDKNVTTKQKKTAGSVNVVASSSPTATDNAKNNKETPPSADTTSTEAADKTNSNSSNSPTNNTTVDATAQAETTSAAATTTAVDMSAVNASAGEVMVKLVFKDEVWMRVNSKKKKVFSGLKKSGDSEEFKTQKPLSFKVGNAPGVDIYINGKLYDQTPHMRGVVAKFKVGDN